jgi:hypothetical protein
MNFQNSSTMTKAPIKLTKKKCITPKSPMIHFNIQMALKQQKGFHDDGLIYPQ